MNDMTNRRMIYNTQITIDDMGYIHDAQIWSQYFLLKNKYVQAGLSTHTGAVEHNLVFSVDNVRIVLCITTIPISIIGEHVSGNDTPVFV